jgi:hypothetical protein
MKIEVLGTGCYRCIQLESLLAEALSALGLRGAEVVRVSDEKAIRRRMPPEALPGLVIDGVLISTGKLPEREQLLAWLRAAGDG